MDSCPEDRPRTKSNSIFEAQAIPQQRSAAVGWIDALLVSAVQIQMVRKSGHLYCAYYALFRCFHPLAGCLDFRGAELEFGNLAERIERRIGEDVRRRFNISEGDEHDAVRNSIIQTRVEFDSAAPGGHANHVAGLDAELGDSAT